MIQNVAVDDKFTDVAVVGGSDKNVVVVLDKDGVSERMPHSAVLVCKSLRVLGQILLAAPIRIEDRYLCSAREDLLHIHHLERIHMNMKDVRFAD